MSDAMIEKVARAVYACHCRTNNVRADWNALDMEERVQFKVEAVVAIEAMREPDGNMQRAYWLALGDTASWSDGLRGYQAMIDAAVA